MQPPIPYSADLEHRQPDEDETIAEINTTFDTILERTSKDYGHAVRSVHAKAHALLAATLTIEDGLAPELAQGLFAVPGDHRVALRLSTNAGDILDDAISLPRGLSMKVFDVPGERLPDAEGSTQDFIMVNGPVFQAKTAAKFLTNLKLLAKTTDRAEGGKKMLSAALRGVRTALEAVGIESAAINTLGGAPNVEPLGETFYSVTPFRYGDYVAKFSAVPITDAQRALSGEEIDASEDYDAVRTRVRQEMRDTDVAWELRVQLLRDVDKQPIEDATVAWPEDVSPFQRVGVIRAGAQDSWSDAHVRDIDEGLRFSVWTGLAAHRPLGNINRARNAPYRHSAEFRARFNGCPLHEPGTRTSAAAG